MEYSHFSGVAASVEDFDDDADQSDEEDDDDDGSNLAQLNIVQSGEEEQSHSIRNSPFF